MPSISFIIKNKKNKGLLINDRELLALYFYGVSIINDQYTGISSTTMETFIRRAQQELEKFLSIKLTKQLMEENSDYYRQEFQGTGFVKTKFTVTKPLQLHGYIGGYKQIEYPKEWLTSNVVDGVGIARQMLVVPNSNATSVAINAALFAGSVVPHLGLANTNSIGSYWHVKYITGFDYDHLPYDVLEIVGKLSAINLFNMLGDVILGAGIASSSLSIDGISQSISSTSSATSSGYGARIINYMKEIDESLKRLRGVYKGLTLLGI